MIVAILFGLLTPALSYATCAALPWYMGRRHALAPAVACWRSPLGLAEGLLLHLTPLVVGGLVAAAVAWATSGSVEILLDPAADGVVHEAAALIGTLAGGLGGLLAVVWAYRQRGAGWVAAGLRGLPLDSIVRPATVIAFLLIGSSMLYNIVFEAVLDRQPASVADPMIEFVRGGDAAWIWLPLLVVAAVVMAPLVEEVIYRGVIYRAFRERGGSGLAMLASGLLFGLSHFQLDYLLPLWAIGVVLAWTYERSGSLLPAILTHAIYNGCALTIGLSGA